MIFGRIATSAFFAMRSWAKTLFLHQQFFRSADHCVRLQILHAIIFARRRVVARTRKIGFQNSALAVEFEFVTIKDIVEQDDLFLQSDCQMESHRNCRNDEVALVDQIDEAIEGIMAEVPRAACPRQS
jgi:hypothetical protein